LARKSVPHPIHGLLHIHMDAPGTYYDYYSYYNTYTSTAPLPLLLPLILLLLLLAAAACIYTGIPTTYTTTTTPAYKPLLLRLLLLHGSRLTCPVCCTPGMRGCGIWHATAFRTHSMDCSTFIWMSRALAVGWRPMKSVKGRDMTSSSAFCTLASALLGGRSFSSSRGSAETGAVNSQH
jgi:hypothetical protein